MISLIAKRTWNAHWMFNAYWMWKTTLNVVETVSQQNFGKDETFLFQKVCAKDTNISISTKLQTKSTVCS